MTSSNSQCTCPRGHRSTPPPAFAVAQAVPSPYPDAQLHRDDTSLQSASTRSRTGRRQRLALILESALELLHEDIDQDVC